MSDLTEFLLARIAEDEERLVHEFDCERFNVRDYGTQQGECDCHATARLLRECEAKRRIMERHSPCDDWSYGDPATCPELCALAAVYADHPDYNEQEWRP